MWFDCFRFVRGRQLLSLLVVLVSLAFSAGFYFVVK